MSQSNNPSSFKAKSKRKLFVYSEAALQQAINEIKDKKLSIREASRNFAVPRSTIQDRLKGVSKAKLIRKPGPQPILTADGEEKIANWVLNLAKCGFPITKNHLMETGQKF